MNIVIATETYLPFIAGVSTSTDNIVRFLARKGHRVTVIAPRPVIKSDIKPEKNVTIIHTPSFPDPFFRGKSFSPIPLPLWTVFSAITHDTDLVHIQEPGAIGMTACMAAKIKGIPTVGALHFTPDQILRILAFPGKHLSITLIQALMRWFYNGCNGVMVPTQTFVSYLKRIGVRKDMCVVSNGVDTKDFVPTKNRLLKRSANGLPKDKILFFFLGRLDFDKHADTIIRALPNTDTNVHLVIAGEGKEEKNFRNLANTLGVSERITWLGYLSHEKMKEVYQSVDCFVLMSPYEVQSIVTLQAISSGLPVLACKEGALPELCHDGENGFTIATDDDKTLAEKMNILASDSKLRVRMGRESRKISLPHDRNTALEKLERFYTTILR